jgi:hypothetical protein
MDRKLLYSIITSNPGVTHASFVNGAVYDLGDRCSFIQGTSPDSGPYRLLGHLGLLDANEEAPAFYLQYDLGDATMLVIKNYHVDLATVRDGELIVPYANVKIRFFRQTFDFVPLS